MTVPGKGGRPRKWASDRDRQRAWRARQQGQPEPTQYRESLDDGDLLATALAERDDLADQLRALQLESEDERRQTDREIGELQQRLAAFESERMWTANELDAVRARLRTAEEEREQFRVETLRLRKELATPARWRKR